MFIELALLSIFVLALGIFYRLRLHPLAKYPGPLLGRLTDWYSVYHSIKADRHTDFAHLHKKYGPFVRYGPNRLSINDATALKTIYGTQPELRKSSYYDAMQFYMKYPSTNATTDIAQHARKRRTLAPALSDRMLQVYEPGYLRILESFMGRFGKKDASTVYDLDLEFTLLSFDSMGDFCFGKTFGSLEDPKKAEIVSISSDGLRGLNAVAHMPEIAHLKLDKLNRKMFQAMEEYKSYAAALAQECINRSRSLSSSEQAMCVLDVLLMKSRGKQGDGISVPELESESSLLVTAGTDTTASALSSTVFHLLNNPRTMAHLATEIRRKFTDASQIKSGSLLQECEYLSACIDESLRLSPPVGGCLQRIAPVGGIVVDGHHIPGGTDVGVPHYAVMRNGRYFNDPLAFKPERWIASETSEVALRNMRMAFCPFSLGPTGCIGKAWALMELKLALAHLVFRYDLELVAASEEEKHQSAIERMLLRERKTMDKFVVCGIKSVLVRVKPRGS